MKTISFAFCGAFYEHNKAFEKLITLKNNYEVLPVVSQCVYDGNKNLIEKLNEVSKDLVNSMLQAEKVCSNHHSEALVIAPCTGNTLAKIANGISDGAVTMLAKSHMRNNKPVIIAIATNDGLGLNMFNLAKLMNQKNVYFVPFKQDNPQKKPKSLMCDFDLIDKTVEQAFLKEQLQPVLI